MKTLLKASSAAVAASFAFAAVAVAGGHTYESDAYQITFAEEGMLHVLVKETGEESTESYSKDDDGVVTFTSAEDGEGPCAGISGSYNLTETDTGIAFELIADDCAERVEAAAATWTLVETEEAADVEYEATAAEAGEMAEEAHDMAEEASEMAEEAHDMAEEAGEMAEEATE